MKLTFFPAFALVIFAVVSVMRAEDAATNGISSSTIVTNLPATNATSDSAAITNSPATNSLATNALTESKAATNSPVVNVLTDAEKDAGWKLLFNGTNFSGWHNYNYPGLVAPGWQVTNGMMMCVNPRMAGDLVTEGQYDWFELELDYNISEAGNSGIMYHVVDGGFAVWASGPEFQLEDNKEAVDPVRCGWLYGLYQPPIDPATSNILDATKPVGEWNHVRLVVSQEKCEHFINGVKYFEYVLDSDDWKQRVAASKFATMAKFAKSNIGAIALQGDHGQIKFQNIKIRAITPKK